MASYHIFYMESHDIQTLSLSLSPNVKTLSEQNTDCPYIRPREFLPKDFILPVKGPNFLQVLLNEAK